MLVTIDSPTGSRLVEVPEAARVDALLAGLVEVCEGRSDPSGWSLAPLGEAPLAGGRTLAECGLFPGAVLLLVEPQKPDEVKAPGIAQRLGAGLRPSTRIPDIERIGDADYLRLLDDAIAAPRSGASSVVAVMSAHAGAGSSTVTLLLAMLLSTLRTDQVAVVDACPQSGALSHWLAPESGLSRNTYRSLFEPPPAPERVRAAMVGIGRGLAVLPAPSDQRNSPAADEPAWGRLIQHLRHLNHVVILDCGSGFQGPVKRAALETADQVVLVCKSQPHELDFLGPTIESIRGVGRTVVVVANQAPQRARVQRSTKGVQMLTLAYEPQPAQRLKTRGFSWSDAPDSWQESMRELVAILIGSWRLSEPVHHA